MKNKFSNALFGYRKKEVTKVLDCINDEFQLELKEYSYKEEELKKENIKLIAEFNELNEQIKEYNYLNDKLVDILYNSHINQTSRIYDVQSKLYEMFSYKTEVIGELQEKNEKINFDIKNLINNIDKLTNND